MTKTILIIEDNDQNMYLIRYILRERGYDVVEAKSGPAGMRLAQEHTPDLILLDIQLPGMDGYEVASELRKTGAVADTPIVAVTSYAMPGDREKVMNAGCNGHIEKPIKPATFVREVEHFLYPKDPSERTAQWPVS